MGFGISCALCSEHDSPDPACYIQGMKLLINGQARLFPELNSGATVQDLLNALALKADRIAVEHNGSIVSRTGWAATPICDGDQFEIVHFVGGGSTRRRIPKL